MADEMDPHDLSRAISRFYHRWHALEATFGADNGNILDFDFCPREDLQALEPPFPSRLNALRVLEQLRANLAGLPPEAFCNHAYLSHKLMGSAAYLRALMGERPPLHDYLYATMGIRPELIPSPVLAALRAELEARFGQLGIPFSQDGLEKYDHTVVRRDLTHFEANLRAEAARWVERLRARIGLSAHPNFSLEVVNEDAYWANWIDGSIGLPVRLRVNIHPRITYTRGSETSFAVHEIGGHALHVLEMDAARRRGGIDAPSLNLTVHSCEAFQMEGLAQTVLQLAAQDGEVPEELELEQKLKAYHGALCNNAQIEIEAGRPIDEVVTATLEAAPFLKPLKLLSDLRDRARHPLYRAYIHVYGPSRHRFLAALSLPRSQRLEFLRRMYTALWTPEQISAELKALARSAVSPATMRP